MSAPVWVAVALLGGTGAVARFVLDAAVSARGAGRIPTGTLAVNVSGTLALGLLSGLALRGEALVLVGAATLGSYTTFSTWMLETHRQTEEGELGLALLNVVLGLGAGFAAAALGRVIGAQL